MEKILIANYIINDKEAQMIKNCLHYALHRLEFHPPAGIHKTGVKLEDIKKLSKEF